MSLKRDFARLGRAFDDLTPEQRDRIVTGLVEFSSLLRRFRPTLEGIGEGIAGALDPKQADKLGRALKDVGVSLLLGFAKGCAFGGPDASAHKLIGKVADAVDHLPDETSATFRPVLGPWEASG